MEVLQITSNHWSHHSCLISLIADLRLTLARRSVYNNPYSGPKIDLVMKNINCALDLFTSWTLIGQNSKYEWLMQKNTLCTRWRKKKEPNQKATGFYSISSAFAGAHLHAIYMVAHSDHHHHSNFSVSIICWHSVIVSSLLWLSQSAEDMVQFLWL